jgi:hypothetical protein
MPDVFHLFTRSNRFSGLCNFRMNQIRNEASALLNMLKTYEDQYKYLHRMQDQTQADLKQIRLHLFKRGFGELLVTEPDEIQFSSESSKYSSSDLFLNRWHEHSIFVTMGGDLYDTSCTDELDASEEMSQYCSSD